MTSRRDLCVSLSAMAALAQLAALQGQGQQAAGPAQEPGASASTLAAGTAMLRNNTIFRADQLPIKTSAVGSSQAVVHGTLPSGEGVELHNSTLLPGREPHPPHQHPHEEFLFLREGNVEWLVDGVRQPAQGGDILYAAGNTLHGLRNIGTTTAKYFVLAIGSNLRTA